MRLKTDLFGTVTRVERTAGWAVERDTRAARWWLRPLARRLASREARALQVLAGIAGVPTLETHEHGVLVRSWTPGEPMQRARPRDPRYFREALRLLRRLHRRGVAHNDLAKEPNWLVTPQGQPALVDFQLALTSQRRGRLFRALARDDIRHLLKHKRSYCPARLTPREHRILATPSWPARLWMSTGKKLYLGVTRGLLGWADREGAGDRNWKS
jgi:RIO-like serine/threonine protein kinase